MSLIVRCRTIDGNMQEVDAGDLAFRPRVYGVIIRDGKILLMPQWFEHGPGYDFPGGGIELELGETIGEALRREIREETGLEAERGEIVHCESDFFVHPITGKPEHSILIYYVCTNVHGEISSVGFDENEKKYSKKAEWIDLSRVSELKFYNPVNSVEIIEKAMKIIEKS